MWCGAAALFFVAAMPVSLHAQALAGRVGPNGKTFRDGRILIIPKAGRDAALVQRHGAERTRVRHHHRELGNVQVIELPPGADVNAVLARYRASGDVVAAELDRWYFPAIEPNDPSYFDGTQWHLNNTGQNGGTPDADIDAPEAWDTLNSASNVIVAVVDTGVRVTHQDLAANIWTNAAGQRGYNAINPGADPLEDFLHGTHVAGIIGAVGNNGVGACGVAWKVKIMPCKFIGPTTGSESDLFECLAFATTNGAKVVNCSFVAGAPYSVALSNAFLSLRNAGIIVVAAAGNNWTDNDVTPYYPGAFALDNVVCVTATTRNDGQAYNFGANTVHLGAPGIDIYSTWGSSDAAYANNSGTSMATPMVAGAAALLMAKYPGENARQIINRILASVDVIPSLTGRCRTGGRLNLARAISPSLLLADFISSSPARLVSTPIYFTNASIGAITNWTWNFGDGSPVSHATSPSHTYATAGVFTVTLTVTDTNGASANTNGSISIVNQYAIQAAPFDWVSTTGLTPLSLGNEDVSPAQTLPFLFNFYGQKYSQVFVSANGLVGFVNDNLSSGANADLPSGATPNTVIYPYWDDLNPAAGGTIWFGVIGEAPNRRAVASWNAVPHNIPMGGATTFTLQAILHEGGAIAFQYLQVESGNATRIMGKSATIGVEDSSGVHAAKYTYNGSPSVVTNGQAMVFTTTGHVPPVPGLAVLPAPAGQFAMRISAEPGRSYVIQTCTNFPSWTPLVTNLVPASGVINYTNAAPLPRRFYRALLQ